MKIFKWELSFGILLVGLTVLLTFLHYLIFHDVRTLFFYIMEDIVFLPIQVLLVTLVLQGLLSIREKRAMLEKLNMVIEVFFSEVGTGLFKHLFEFDRKIDSFRNDFQNINAWTERDFREKQQQIKTVEMAIDCQHADLDGLRGYLMGKRNFMLRLLENPNLLEHETFTELLWAVFHLTEELAHRKSCSELCEADRGHLSNDIQRAYVLLIYEWLAYIKHLKTNYPYLFSLAVRLNPFDPEAMAEVRE